MNTKSIIDLWPNISQFAADIGVSYNTAKHIRRRGTIPAQYWNRAVAGAAARKIPGVTLARLAKLAEEWAARQSEDAA